MTSPIYPFPISFLNNSLAAQRTLATLLERHMSLFHILGAMITVAAGRSLTMET
jgi:hypothetical protein